MSDYTAIQIPASLFQLHSVNSQSELIESRDPTFLRLPTC